MSHWRRSQVKSGRINIEKIEGMGYGGLPPEKNQFCAKKIMQFWASFGTSFLYYSIKSGIIPQSWKWGTYPPVPRAPTPMKCHPVGGFSTLKVLSIMYQRSE